ncbi:hypothetical protein [Rhizobium sp. IMFF44]|uniref:hypothetical protein n=1 Tax=Rhizobium sp. IMFF44 TaxID=3342350 RepID=UPI0035BAF49C
MKFEELCRDVLKEGFPELNRVALKRKTGVMQFGVDVEGFDRLGFPEVVLSAKCYKRIRSWEFRPWIQQFIDELEGHWKDKNVKHFILAVSVEANDDDMNDQARELAVFLNSKGIQFHLWDTVRLTELLRNQPALVDRHFHKHWTEAISALGPQNNPTVEPTAAVSLKNLGIPLAAIADQLAQTYIGPLNNSIANELENAIGALRQGRRAPVRKWLDTYRTDTAIWNSLDEKTRARGLRLVAVIDLAEGNPVGASGLLDEADRLEEAPDRSARVLYVRSTEGIPAALRLLGEPVGLRETELAAGLMIENEQPEQATQILSGLLGDSVSVEVLRLRAIAKVLSGGDREAALNLATSALAREQSSAIGRLTRATIHVACSLVDDVFPTFGNAPSPFSSSLVRSGPRALEHLNQARNDLESLVSAVEGELKAEVEVWKLAVLLLNPATTREARVYARFLLSRDQPDPLVVAWCLHHGLPLRRGKVKKVLGDVLRKKLGTPSHVVVLAMMTSAFATPAAAVSVIDKFAGDFPSAQAFFSDWRQQFAANAGPPDQSYSAGIRHVIETGDAKPLKTFLASERSSVEAILSGSEFLMSRGLFADVNDLASLLSRIDTTRAVEIAAYAALRTDDPASCLAIVEQTGQKGLDLPDKLVRLRAEAQALLGNHRDQIKDLKQLVEKGDDPQARSRLFDAYVNIGALEEVKLETERALRAGSLGHHDAVRLASALKGVSPEMARLLLTDITKSDIPAELAGPLLSLSAELGLDDLQEKTLRLVLSDPRQNMVTRFDDVEQVLDHIKKHAEAQRTNVLEWLHGRLPASVALGNAKEYALLFLGDTLTRRTSSGDSFPMLLNATTTERPKPSMKDRPKLRVDLGALLLADRLGLVDALDRQFSIQIPRSLPQALIDMEAQFGKVSRPIVDGIRAIAEGNSAVQIVDSLSDTSVELAVLMDTPEDGESLDVLNQLLEQAYRGGHVTRWKLDDVRAALKIARDRRQPARIYTGILMAGSALFDLLKLDLLEPLARSFPIQVLESELDRHLVQIDIAEAEEIIGKRISNLRQRVSDRLASNWTTVGAFSETAHARTVNFPAHVRCLTETFPREDEADSLFWIEDRLISARSPVNAVNLGQVLSVLREAGELDDRSYPLAMKTLREAGYSFLPLDLNEILSTLQAAAVVNGRVVGNEDLKTLRRWVARDVVNLRYLDPTLEIDGEGRPSGESRRMLSLSQLSSGLIISIWQNPDIAIEDAAAQSAWVWANLRVDYLPSPPASDNALARRHLAAMNVTHILFSTLQSDLGRDKFPEDRRAPFAKWVLENAVAPMVAVDREMEDLIAVFLAGLIEGLTADPDDIDADLADVLRAQMVRVIGRFLELLPRDFANRIAGHHGIDEFLGREDIMLLEVGNDHQIAVRDIDAAFTAAVDGSGAEQTVLSYKHEVPGTLKILDEAGLPSASIEFGSGVHPFDRATLAVLHPAQEVRAKLLESVTNSGMTGPQFSAYQVDVISKEQSAERRVELLHDVLAADFERTLSQLRQRIDQGGTLDLDDLKLPSPATMLEFLGLPPMFEGDGPATVDAATDALFDRFGLEAAVERLSSLPFAISDRVAKAIMDLMRQEVVPQRMAWSFAIAALIAKADNGGLAQDDFELLDQLSKSRLKLFCTLLGGSARQALGDPRWLEVKSDVAFLLIWLHADQLTRVFDVEQMPLDDLTSWVAGRSKRKLTESDDQKGWEPWVARSLLAMTPNRLRAAAFAELLRVGAELPRTIAEKVGQGSGESWVPMPDLLVQLPECPSSFWPAQDPVHRFLSAGWMSKSHTLAARDGSKLLHNIASEMTDENWRPLTSLVALVIDLAEASEEAVAALMQRLEAYSTPTALAEDDVSRGALLDVIAKTYGRRQRRQDFEFLMIAIAKLGNRKWPENKSRDRIPEGAYQLGVELINAIYLYEWARGVSVAERLRGLSDLVKKLTLAWPTVQGVSIATLEATASQFDVATACEGIWPVLTEMRAM